MLTDESVCSTERVEGTHILGIDVKVLTALE